MLAVRRTGFSTISTYFSPTYSTQLPPAPPFEPPTAAARKLYALRQWTATITKPKGWKCQRLSYTHTSVDAIEKPEEISARMEAELPTCQHNKHRRCITQEARRQQNGQGRGKVRFGRSLTLPWASEVDHRAEARATVRMRMSHQCRLVQT